MISLIRDDYNVLQALGSFGIQLGFGDKTVAQVCHDNDVDTNTFLAVVNLAINGYADAEPDDQIQLPTLLKYLRASHAYYIDFQLPFIRKELTDSLGGEDAPKYGYAQTPETSYIPTARLILKLYEDYAREIRKHMKYEEKTLFPYVQSLIDGQADTAYNIDTFSRHHSDIDAKLSELKMLIIKYLPSNSYNNNRLTATLYDIYNNEEWLRRHTFVEDKILVPAIRKLEEQLKRKGVSGNLTSMVFPQGQDQGEALSQREKDVIVAVVQGMSNKQIADHLFISVNTVTTHRRNIARKLQIHSTAGLTIYAIVNGLVDISSVKL